MGKILKKFLCVLIVVLMVFTSVPVSKLGIEASAADGVQIKINEILSKFPSGSYFTANARTCAHSNWATCDNCRLSKVLPARGLKYDSSIYPDGWTCYAFASFCFGYIFNRSFLPPGSVGIASSGRISNNQGLYNTFKNAKTGDFVYCWKPGNETPAHYAIFVSCDANGVTLLHNNIGGSSTSIGKIAYGYITYENLRVGGYGYNRVDIYRASNYDEVNGTTSSALIKTTYPANCIVRITSDATKIRNMPCSENTDSNSKTIETASKNTEYQACELILNKAGNLWYKIKTKSGSTGYVYAGNTSYKGNASGEIKVTGITVPSNHAVGKTYSLKGSVSTTYCKLAAVSVYIYKGTANTGTAETGYSVSVSGNSYSFAGSTIDSKTLFDKLPMGTHTYVVRASYLNYYAKSSTQVQAQTTTVTPYQATFNVVSSGASSGTTSGKDTQKPDILEVVIKDVNSTGYTVTCKASDNVGVTRVAFPTWTHNNGQDDLLWKDGTISGNTATFRVNKSDHQGESGWYATHIYVYDRAGNTTVFTTDLLVPPDGKVYETTYNGNKYVVYKGKVSYQCAKDLCESYGGYLAKITSAEENEAVASIVSKFGKCWINGSDEVTEGTWLFSDGYRITYTNWNTGEPNNSGGNQDYLAMETNGKWDDGSTVCDGFVCELNHTHSYVSKITKQPTCTSTGTKTFTCSCGASYTETIAKNAHSYQSTTIKADLSNNGKIINKCSVCGYVNYEKTIYYPETVELSALSYVYDGGAKTPSVIVKGSNGNVLKQDSDYKVTYENSRKEIGQYSVTVTFIGNYEGETRLSFEIVPAKPSGIMWSCSSSAIKLTWNAVQGADGYRVYQYNSKTKKWVKIKTTTSTEYKVNGLKAGTTYKYKIKAYKHINDETIIWSSSSVTIKLSTTPSVTNKISATQTTSSITLKWNKVSGATGYRVYQYDTKNKKWVKIKTTSTNSYKVKNLKQGTTYKYIVKAYKKLDDGTVLWGEKSAVFTTATQPTATNKIVAKRTRSTVTLSWNKVAGATGYRVYQYNAKTKKWVKIKTTTANSYKVTGLKANTNYYYIVKSYKMCNDTVIWSANSATFKTKTLK